MIRRRMANAKKATVETVELIKTTSTWTVPAGCKSVDVFLVGGGGGGSSFNSTTQPVNYANANGGGGGYTKTIYSISVTPGSQINITIGGGGLGGIWNGDRGGYTQFMNSTYQALGGYGGVSDASGGYGGDGGSGGGAGGGNGGSNGSNGSAINNGKAGKGQGSSTVCPFNNITYAGGGGGAGKGYGSGGTGGGGSSAPEQGYPGTANTGGGGGGSWGGNSGSSVGGKGGSGIVVLHYFKY